MSHSCPNLVSTSFLYNPYIPFLICRNFFLIIIIIIINMYYNYYNTYLYMYYNNYNVLPLRARTFVLLIQLNIFIIHAQSKPGMLYRHCLPAGLSLILSLALAFSLLALRMCQWRSFQRHSARLTSLICTSCERVATQHPGDSM